MGTSSKQQMKESLTHKHKQGKHKQQQKLKGITYDPSRRNWKARIHFAGRERFIGRYPSRYEAALAFDQAARVINEVIRNSQSNTSSSSSSSAERVRSLNFPHIFSHGTSVFNRLSTIFADIETSQLTAAAAAAYAETEALAAAAAAAAATAAATALGSATASAGVLTADALTTADAGAFPAAGFTALLLEPEQQQQQRFQDAPSTTAAGGGDVPPLPPALTQLAPPAALDEAAVAAAAAAAAAAAETAVAADTAAAAAAGLEEAADAMEWDRLLSVVAANNSSADDALLLLNTMSDSAAAAAAASTASQEPDTQFEVVALDINTSEYPGSASTPSAHANPAAAAAAAAGAAAGVAAAAEGLCGVREPSMTGVQLLGAEPPHASHSPGGSNNSTFTYLEPLQVTTEPGFAAADGLGTSLADHPAAAAAAALPPGSDQPPLFGGLKSPSQALVNIQYCLLSYYAIEKRLLLQRPNDPPLLAMAEWLLETNQALQQQQQQQQQQASMAVTTHSAAATAAAAAADTPAASMSATASPAAASNGAAVAVGVYGCVFALLHDVLSSRPAHATSQRFFLLVVLARLRSGLVYLQQHAFAAAAAAGCGSNACVGLDLGQLFRDWVYDDVLSSNGPGVKRVLAGLSLQV